MSNILLSEENKELLWNILYNNNAFKNIPDSKFDVIKSIFESNIAKSLQKNQEIISNKDIIRLNKVILQNILIDVNNLKKSFIDPINSKDNYKNERTVEFEKEFLEKKESFNNLMVKQSPKTIDFSDSKDKPLENNIMNELLEKMQKERNNTMSKSLPIDIKVDLKNINININKDPIKLELVDLNDLDKDLKENDLKVNELEKTKISNIEDLLFDFTDEDTSNEESYNNKNINQNNIKTTSSQDSYNNTANNFLDINKYKKRNSRVSEKELADLINYDYATEFNMNLAIKIDLLNRQIETLLTNQKLIMAKLNI